MGRNFSVSLSQVPKLKGHKVPYVVEKLIDYLQENALYTEGLFRVPGAFDTVQILIHELDEGRDVDLSLYSNYEVAEALKKFFSYLPEPLVPEMIDNHVKKLFDGQRRPAEEILPEMKFAVDTLGEDNYAVLEKLSKFLSVLVSHSDRNKMNLSNIVTCFAPSLRFKTPAILSYCIQHHDYFFGLDISPPEDLKSLALTAESRKPSVINPNNRKSVPNLNFQQKLEQSTSDLKIKEEVLKEKFRLKEEYHKEKKQMKEEWHKEKQQLKEEVAKEKEYYQEELSKEKRRLKAEYSAEKRLLKDEICKLQQEIEVWKTISQARKEKLESMGELNYELERKLKKQQLKKKAMQLDIEMLERKLKQTKPDVSSMMPQRVFSGSPRDAEFSREKDFQPVDKNNDYPLIHDYPSTSAASTPHASDTEVDRAKEKYRKDNYNLPRKHSRVKSGSTSSSSSTTTSDKRVMSGYLKSDSLPIEGERILSSKDKAKELLKKNTTKLLQESARSRKALSLELAEELQV